jgi:SpoVK/Ycf46/Vps4 family AAA+-type ATPase
MAAEVIASDLQLDLYKIDLSQVVSKYIGETEKNLNRVFTAAANSNAILLFDELIPYLASVPKLKTRVTAMQILRLVIYYKKWMNMKG